MYTRCPTCSTCFRVTERHLAIAKGKVRCGQCQLVFNAPEHAIDDLPVTTTSKATAKSTLATSLDSKISPAPAPIKKVAPAPIAPTAKEKLEAETKINQGKETLTEKPETKASSAFDSNATMIADLSTLNKNEVEEVNLDSSCNDQNDDTEDDNSLFNNNVDFNTAIDELSQTTTTELDQQDNVLPDEKEKASSVNKNSTDNVFHTDAYNATSASSVADIVTEMEGQLSLDIPEPENDKFNEYYDAKDEFDFLKLDKESNEQLNEQADSENDNTNNTNEFSEVNDEDEDEELIDLNAETIQKENFDTALDEDKTENVNEVNEDELTEYDDFEDDDLREETFIEEFSIENDESQNSDEFDVPIQLRNDIEHLQSSPKRTWHPIFTLLFIIILLVLSFSQLAFFRSHDLVKKIPASRPLVEAFCQTIGCHYSGPQDTKQIQLLSRDVRLHPKEKKALLISAAIINNAYFAQPYPNIHVRLSDISGNVVAERIFNSKSYMGKLSTPFLLMKPKTPVHINFEVVDPGSDAVNFEFNFL